MKKIFDEALKDQTLPPTDWSFLRLALVPRAPASAAFEGVSAVPPRGLGPHCPLLRLLCLTTHPTPPSPGCLSPAHPQTSRWFSLLQGSSSGGPADSYFPHCASCIGPAVVQTAPTCDCFHRCPSCPLDVKVHEGRNAVLPTLVLSAPCRPGTP